MCCKTKCRVLQEILFLPAHNCNSLGHARARVLPNHQALLSHYKFQKRYFMSSRNQILTVSWTASNEFTKLANMILSEAIIQTQLKKI